MHAQDAPIYGAVLRGAGLATAAAAPVALGVSWATAGRAGLAAAGLAFGIVAAFFTLSIAALARVGARVLLPAALGVYVAKIVALGLALHALGSADFIDHTAFGWSAFAALVVWLSAEVTAFARARIPYVQPGAEL